MLNSPSFFISSWNKIFVIPSALRTKNSLETSAHTLLFSPRDWLPIIFPAIQNRHKKPRQDNEKNEHRNKLTDVF